MTDTSGVIVEYITKDNVDAYPYLAPAYKELLLNGTLENIKIERKEKEIVMADILKLNEYRLRRKERRKRLRQKEREMKKIGLVMDETCGSP